VIAGRARWCSRHARSLLIAVAVLLSGKIAQAEAEAAFRGFGPLPARNFQPVQQIFLNLPFERARVLGVGEYSIRLESAESNVIATNQLQLDAVLKFEQNRTVLGSSVGVSPGLELGLDVPMLSRFGGFLDPFIDSVEKLFGAYNVERGYYPNNSFGGFYLRRDGQTLFEGPKQQFALGDIWASGKYVAFDVEGWPLVSIRAAIKAPTGRASGVFGSGRPDFGLGFAAEYQALSWLVTYANFNVIYPLGPITGANLSLNPFVTGGVAAEAYLGWGVSVVLEQATYTSPIHGIGTRLLDGTVVELSGGLNWMCAPILLQLGAINNVSPVATAADFTLMLRATWFGGQQPSATANEVSGPERDDGLRRASAGVL